jgi:apolipoprotein N-acyltransferase
VARLGAAGLAGVLAALSRPPADVGPLAAVALVPLFLAWRGRGARAAAGLAFVAGAVYYSLLCWWIWYFGTVAMVPFVAACAAYWAAAGAVAGWLGRRRAVHPFAIAAVWVLADAGVARFPFGGLSWGELGYAFHDAAPARAVASVGGVTLVTFLAVAGNAFLADVVAAAAQGRVRRAVVAHAGLAVIAVAVVAATVTRTQPDVTRALHVALLQGNDKNRDLTEAELDARYLPNSHFDLASRIGDPVDLIVFPESSMDADPRTDPYVHGRLTGFARRHRAWVLANATVDAPPDGSKALNLNVLFDPNGRITGTYAKRHLVPYGEYVPFRGLLEGWIPALDRVPRDYAAGDRNEIFDVAGTPVATVICFESVFARQVRDAVRDGAEVLVVSTNNRSYRRSANSAQHVAIGRMRAAETGRPVVHAAISGITAVIDADGRLHERADLFERTTVETTIAATTGQTPYVRYGEWVLAASAALVLASGAVALVRRRRPASVDSNADETVSVAARIEGYGSTTRVDEVT